MKWVVAFAVAASGCSLLVNFDPALLDGGGVDGSTTDSGVDAGLDAQVMPDSGCSTDAQCDDHNPCTRDRCVAGTCSSANDDALPCAGGSCRTGACCTGCWDGTACQTGTLLSACGARGAACLGCLDDTNPCTDTTCSAGSCRQTNVDTHSCDDGNPCTHDACSGGTCTGRTDDSATCSGGICHSGACCLGCWDGSTCQPGNSISACGSMGTACSPCADDTSSCTDAVCNAGSCGQTDNDSNSCDDGNACTDDVCSSGSCLGMTDDSNSCAGGTCHTGACCQGCWDGAACQAGTSTGLCGNRGDACTTCLDDSNSCTDASCDSGVCGQTGNDANPCSDGNTCTDDACFGGSCVPMNNTDACTGGACHAGACCLGCWNGAACLTGDTVATCGELGAACNPCNTPPASTCADSIATNYTPSCDSHACVYTPISASCPEACSNGICVSSFAARTADADDRVLVTDTAGLFPDEFTVELWASFDSLAVTDPMQMLAIAEGPGFALFYLRAYNDNLECVLGNGTGATIASVPTSTVTTGALHHIACTRDASAVLTLWLDGNPVATTPAPIYAPPTGQILGLGGDYRTPPEPTASGFRGVIDEVRISSIARYSAVFVPARRLTASGGTVALWHFDEGTGTTVANVAGSGHTGTLSGGAAWIPQP